jgi:peptidoglycan/xylan/chitin deacetylase (PgdA/CDA1 family)
VPSLPNSDLPHTPDRLFLLYHEVRPEPSDYSYAIDEAMFKQHLALYQRLRTADSELWPELTFDDGHASDAELAAPVLADHGLTAHFFITVGWTGKRTGYMDWPQIRALQEAGHTIGAHGWSHKLLTHCTAAELTHELRDARVALEDHLGTPVTTMSLPGGRANSRVLQACSEAGYTHVFTSEPKPESFPLGRTVGRFNITGDMRPEWLAQLFAPNNPVLAGIRRNARLKQIAKNLLGDSLYAKLWAIRNRQEPDTEDTWEAAE